jgi:hypothetical protein
MPTFGALQVPQRYCELPDFQVCRLAPLGGGPQVAHDGVRCRGCQASPLRGVRWRQRGVALGEYDLCAACHDTYGERGERGCELCRTARFCPLSDAPVPPRPPRRVSAQWLPGSGRLYSHALAAGRDA